MTRAEFLAAFTGKSAATWENAVVDLARRGEIVRWPLVDVTMHGQDGRSITFQAATDYIAVGTPDDALRVPLTPGAMQRVADAFAMVLPTAPMVKAIHEQASVKLFTQGLVPNKGADLAQYVAHDDRIRAEIAGDPSASNPSLLRSGHKKDVVLAGPALLKPRVVLIYGWMNRGPVPAGLDPAPLAGQPWRTQPLSNVHGDFYVDYSHGGRLVHPEATVHEADGSSRVVRLTDAYQDPGLAALLNPGRPEWGAGTVAARYPVPNAGSPIAYVPTTPGFADRGLSEIKERTLERFGAPKS